MVPSAAKEMAARYGLKITSGVDDLDYYDFSSILIPGVGQVWLWQYRRSRVAGTQIVIDAGIDAQHALPVILRALDIGVDALSWAIKS
jgi:hypothetical protein